jgi:tRNA dimethylallyltransferase
MKDKARLPKLIAIVGPTASGKTDLAIALAKKFKGEIISADSRQFYRGTEIGSDIPGGVWTRAEGPKSRRTYVVQGIPHHLMNFLPPSKLFTVAQFKEHVIRIARDISERGHVPLLVGGSGLYVRAVVDNFTIPEVPPNPEFREKMEKKTTAALYKLLEKKDSAYLARIPTNNRRYATRALEVMQATGKTVTELQQKGEPLFDVLQIGIRRSREEMYRRINARIDVMMKNGLLDEAKKLGKKYGWDVPAMSGLGHRQLGAFLRGETSLEDAVEKIKSDTRHFAKRQVTWFKRDQRIKWIKNESEAARLVRKFLER